MSGSRVKTMRLHSRLRIAAETSPDMIFQAKTFRVWRGLRNLRCTMLAFVVAGLTLSSAIGADAPANNDMAIAENLAEMLRDARTVISNHQDLINDPELGNKGLTGKAVRDEAVEIYAKATGVDPTKIDPASREGRLMRAMMAAIVEVVDDHQRARNWVQGLYPGGFCSPRRRGLRTPGERRS